VILPKKKNEGKKKIFTWQRTWREESVALPKVKEIKGKSRGKRKRLKVTNTFRRKGGFFVYTDKRQNSSIGEGIIP